MSVLSYIFVVNDGIDLRECEFDNCDASGAGTVVAANGVDVVDGAVCTYGVDVVDGAVCTYGVDVVDGAVCTYGVDVVDDAVCTYGVDVVDGVGFFIEDMGDTEESEFTLCFSYITKSDEVLLCILEVL